MNEATPTTAPNEANLRWKVEDTLLTLRSRWVTLVVERLRDSHGQMLDYWRVEKADSAVVLPLCQGTMLLPAPSWRPGVGAVTVDFPGGRVEPSEPPLKAAARALERELAVFEMQVLEWHTLDAEGWPVNSSFSSQRLYGFVAELAPTVLNGLPAGTQRIPANDAGIDAMLASLQCLQCRAVLLAWSRRAGKGISAA